MIYQGLNCLLGYYALECRPIQGYTYSRWNIQNTGNYIVSDRWSPGYFTKPDDCDRFLNGSCCARSIDNPHPIPVSNKILSNKWVVDCKTCTQLDKIQDFLFAKDVVVAEIFKNKFDYPEGTIIIREKRPMLNFIFDFGYGPY